MLCHRSADADAICSAYALQGLLKRFMPDVVFEVGCPQGVNKPSKLLLERMPITVNLKPNIESADVIVFLDLNTVEQLDEVAETIKKSPAPKIIVDHHYPNPETTSNLQALHHRRESTRQLRNSLQTFQAGKN